MRSTVLLISPLTCLAKQYFSTAIYRISISPGDSILRLLAAPALLFCSVFTGSSFKVGRTFAAQIGKVLPLIKVFTSIRNVYPTPQNPLQSSHFLRTVLTLSPQPILPEACRLSHYLPLSGRTSLYLGERQLA